MKYQVSDYEAVHQSPVWRDRANFVIAAHIGLMGGKNEWEQLWARRVSGHRFVVCCIPFFVSDIALGDEVETDSDFVLCRVVERSGQATFRVWFGETSAEVRQEIVKEIVSMGPLMEWSSENLLALSVSSDEVQRFANFLHRLEQQSLLQYETGSS